MSRHIKVNHKSIAILNVYECCSLKKIYEAKIDRTEWQK